MKSCWWSLLKFLLTEYLFDYFIAISIKTSPPNHHTPARCISYFSKLMNQVILHLQIVSTKSHQTLSVRQITAFPSPNLICLPWIQIHFTEIVQSSSLNKVETNGNLMNNCQLFRAVNEGKTLVSREMNMYLNAGQNVRLRWSCTGWSISSISHI